MVSVLRALGHPLRLRLIASLCECDATVGRLSADLGVAQPIVSQQLRILRLTKLVSVVRREGRTQYRLEQVALQEVVRSVDRCCMAND